MAEATILRKGVKAYRSTLPFEATDHAVTIEACSTHYTLRHHPRGRVCRDNAIRVGGATLSADCRVDPLTNLQRAVEMGKQLGWLPAELSAERIAEDPSTHCRPEDLKC